MPMLCLRCTQSFVSVAWRGVAFQKHSVSLGSVKVFSGLNSIPAIISSIQRNTSSQAFSSVPGVSASGAPQPLFSSASTSRGVQVMVFLWWLQVRLPFPHLFLRLRQSRPLPSRAQPVRGSYSLHFRITRRY